MLKILSNLWTGSLFGAAAAFLTKLILARQLGPATFGAFSSVLALVTLVAPLAAFGVGGFWLKAFGKEGWEGIRWVRSSIHFTMLSSLSVMFLIVIWAILGPNDEMTIKLFLVLSLYILGQAALELVSALYQLEELYGLLALWQSIPNFLRLITIGGLAYYYDGKMPVAAVALAYASVSVILLAIGAPSFARMLRGEIVLKGHNNKATLDTLYRCPKIGVVEVLRNSWVFGLANIIYLIHLNSNTVLVKYLANNEQAGFYSVSIFIISSAYMFPSIIYQKFLLPKMHRWSNYDLNRLRKTFIRGNLIMIIVGVLALFIILIFAKWGLVLLFGKSYEGSAILLLVLALAVPARFVSSNAGAILMTKENLNKRLFAMSLIIVSNIILSIILIPKYGALGASISVVINEFLMALIFFLIARNALRSVI